MKRIFKVGAQYRTNPKSQIQGSHEALVTQRLENGNFVHKLYDNIHYPKAYIKKVKENPEVIRIGIRRMGSAQPYETMFEISENSK